MNKLLILACALCAVFAHAQEAGELKDERAYADVTWLCAHNSMSNEEDAWLLPNQHYGIKTLLEQGIHAQMWDVWMKDGIPTLRHGNGRFFDTKEKPLSQALEEVKDYLNAQPQAIITLILESYVDDEQLAQAVTKAGLMPMVYKGDITQLSPSLGQLRHDNTRLIILSDKPTSHFIHLWDVAVETNWENTQPKQLDNELRRGKASNTLFIVNHFIAALVPSQEQAEQLNSEQARAKRAQELELRYARKPNFWAMDFIRRK